MVKKDDPNSISLQDILPAMDRKNRNWFDDKLTTGQQDTFRKSAWLYMRYMSHATWQDGNPDLTRYYLLGTNEKINKNFNSLRHHPKLMYLLMTSVTPAGFNGIRHAWIQPGKKGKTTNKRAKLLSRLYPNANEMELEIINTINTDDDIRQYLMDSGWDLNDIKKALKGGDDE